MRAVAGLAAAGILAGGLVGMAPTSASAAYSTVVTFDGARLQLCRATAGGDPVVRFRVDNRRGGHAHSGGVTRRRSSGSNTFVAQAAGGRVSAVRTVPVRSGDRLTGFAQELDGPGEAQAFTRNGLARC